MFSSCSFGFYCSFLYGTIYHTHTHLFVLFFLAMSKKLLMHLFFNLYIVYIHSSCWKIMILQKRRRADTKKKYICIRKYKKIIVNNNEMINCKQLIIMQLKSMSFLLRELCEAYFFNVECSYFDVHKWRILKRLLWT